MGYLDPISLASMDCQVEGVDWEVQDFIFGPLWKWAENTVKQRWSAHGLETWDTPASPPQYTASLKSF